MARAKAASSVVGWPGTITVVEQRSEDGSVDHVLVDGQVCALARLYAFGILVFGFCAF